MAKQGDSAWGKLWLTSLLPRGVKGVGSALKLPPRHQPERKGVQGCTSQQGSSHFSPAPGGKIPPYELTAPAPLVHGSRSGPHAPLCGTQALGQRSGHRASYRLGKAGDAPRSCSPFHTPQNVALLPLPGPFTASALWGKISRGHPCHSLSRVTPHTRSRVPALRPPEEAPSPGSGLLPGAARRVRGLPNFGLRLSPVQDLRADCHVPQQQFALDSGLASVSATLPAGGDLDQSWRRFAGVSMALPACWWPPRPSHCCQLAADPALVSLLLPFQVPKGLQTQDPPCLQTTIQRQAFAAAPPVPPTSRQT